MADGHSKKGVSAMLLHPDPTLTDQPTAVDWEGDKFTLSYREVQRRWLRKLQRWLDGRAERLATRRGSKDVTNEHANDVLKRLSGHVRLVTILGYINAVLTAGVAASEYFRDSPWSEAVFLASLVSLTVLTITAIAANQLFSLPLDGK